MLDILLLRKDLDAVIARLQTRKNPQAFLDVDAFRAFEAERKTLQTRTEELQAQRNSLSKQIGVLKGKGQHAEAEAVMAQVGAIKTELDNSAARLDVIQSELQALLLAVPNLPHESVPVGAGEEGNVVVRSWGTPKAFDFAVKDHVEIGEKLGLDFDTGIKLSGSRFTFMRGPIAQLHRALAQFMLDTQTREHGYTECYTRYIVNADTLRGTGQLPKFEADLFAANKGGQEGGEDNQALYLIPTSEVTLTNVVRDEILAEADLPIKLTAHTPCFRSEAGSADRAPRQQLRSAGRDDRPCRSHPAKAGLAVPGDEPVHRRHGLWRHQDLRPRSVGARAGCLPRDQLGLELRSLPGPPSAGPLQERPGQERTGPHPEWLRPGRGPRAGGC